MRAALALCLSLTLPAFAHAADAPAVQRLAADALPRTLDIAAAHGTDLFASPDGKDLADNAPRALFAPGGDFILSAKAGAGFNGKYDGAALVVIADGRHWGKLLFERGHDGAGIVTTTIAKDAGDDARHGKVEGDAVWLKVARRGDMLVFYSSADGRAWNVLRTFSLGPVAALQVGFSAQAPQGTGYTARFSEIRFQPAGFKDYWKGE